MGLKNRISSGYLYFITMTVTDWVDAFTKPAYKMIIVDSLQHCQEHKDLEVYSWCLMSNHMHMVVAVKEGSPFDLSDVPRLYRREGAYGCDYSLEMNNYGITNPGLLLSDCKSERAGFTEFRRGIICHEITTVIILKREQFPSGRPVLANPGAGLPRKV